jgi:hypothetical protein
MDALELGLKIVDINCVVPHEIEDPLRVERLSGLLRKEGWLKNPPLVVQQGDMYVILDGTTRTGALRSLHYPHILVQAVDPNKARVATWSHIVQGRDIDAFWTALQDLPLLSFHPLAGMSTHMPRDRWAGALQLADGRAYAIEVPKSSTPKEEVQMLNRLVSLYTGEREIRRSFNPDLSELKEEHPDLTAVVSFPQYTVHDILVFGSQGLHVPPGITRCIVPGRILRVNLDLSLLMSEVLTLEQKNLRLQEYIHARLTRQPLRYYEEPIYILED